jgi:hypothetical protein
MREQARRALVTDSIVVHLGVADHPGWAIAVVATTNHEVVDR